MRRISAVLLGLAAAGAPIGETGARGDGGDGADVAARIERLRVELLARTPQGDEADGPTEFSQWPNFWNCRYGYWRNC